MLDHGVAMEALVARGALPAHLACSTVQVSTQGLSGTLTTEMALSKLCDSKAAAGIACRACRRSVELPGPGRLASTLHLFKPG